MNIGKRIKNLREAQGLSGKYIAKQSYISQTYLSDIETGRTLPSLDKLNLICKTLNISLSKFFGDVPELSAELMRLVEHAQKLTEEEIKVLNQFLELVTKRIESDK